jgi:hypothetical protein
MMLRQTHPEIEIEQQTIDELRRKVAWQVSTAYGLPLEEVRVPVVELEPQPEPLPVPVLPQPEREPEPELPPAAFVLPTLTELERLVAGAAATHPDQVEEWRWYLFYLRDFAQPDGTLDDTFSLLVETAFGDLLQAEPRVH